jgi:HSP20 family protein
VYGHTPIYGREPSGSEDEASTDLKEVRTMTLFNSLFDLTRDGTLSGAAPARAFVPPADLFVSPEAVTVTMDVPGLNAETLEIELTGEILTVRGQRQYPPLNRESIQWYRMERGYGKFQRILQVPKGLDPDMVTASIADGVLTIRVPVPEARKPRRIQISSGHQQPTIANHTNWEELEAEVSENSHAEEPAFAGAAS